MEGLHQGYLYQDLLCAFLISENLHRKDFKVAVEQQDSKEDKFDDIVLFYAARKTKFQVKHTSTNNPLQKNNFTTQSSDLNLVNLAKAFIGDKKTRYVIATNRTIQANTFFTSRSKSDIFPFKNKSSEIASFPSHENFIERLTIESSLPNASFDLSKPGNLEKELLESLRTRVGIGQYPNNKVSERDVASRLILLASKLRGTGKGKFIDRDYIFKYINLNFEYGHIVQKFPFISNEYRLYRTETVAKIKGLLVSQKYVILEGAPGSGKSHIFDDTFNQIKKDGTLAVRHFCYLEPTDRLAQERIVIDAMYGNFLHQLERAEPKIAEEIRPYFSATKATLEKFLIKLDEAGKPVVLMVDGLDHLNRVVTQNKLSEDLVENFISNILDLKLPKDSSIFIASQPTADLDKIIKSKKVGVHTLEAWNERMIEAFVKKHNNCLSTERQLIVDKETLGLILKKTEGNPLYLTYVVKEIISSGNEASVAVSLGSLPQLNNDLNNYYKYLTKTSNETDFALMQTLALLDFSVSSGELNEMFPPVHKPVIEATIKKIKPVLKSGIVQGGIRIYHESFRRFIIEESHKNKQKDSDLYWHITEWLSKKGFYESQRTYRYLIPYLIRSNEEGGVYVLLPKDFIAKSLFFFHSPESITSNLNKIADFAGRNQRWDIYCKAVELKRSLHTYTYERAESVDNVYHQAILDVQGPDTFCERLMFDGDPVFSRTAGILLCQKAEHCGGKPPWDFYDVTGVPMSVNDGNEIYYFQQVESAHFLNLIRKSSIDFAIRTMGRTILRNRYAGTEKRQINWLLAEFNFVFGVSQNYTKLLSIPTTKSKKIFLHLAVADYLHRDGKKKEARGISTEVLKTTKDIAQILTGVKCGGVVSNLGNIGDISMLTASLNGFHDLHKDKEVPVFENWYNMLQILSYADPEKVKEARKLITKIDGWYRAWLVFIFDLSLLEAENASTIEKEERLEVILSELLKYAHPFTGNPRAMDLYWVHKYSTDSFRRVLVISKDFSDYNPILEKLVSISNKTTSYLDRSSHGPLDGEKLNSILKEVYPILDDTKKKIVLKRLKENVYSGLASTYYYDSSSFEHLKLASVLSQAGKKSEAKKELFTGCTHLGAYGHRKDATLFEIIEPINFIAKKDLSFASGALLKTYPLAETVWRFTDGRTTKWGITYWIQALVESNLNMATQVMTEMVINDPDRDWRVEIGTEHLCEKLLENGVASEVVADLYETIFRTRDSRIDISFGIKLTETLILKGNKERAQKLIEHIAYNLYCVSAYEYVSEKENYGKILSCARKFKLKLPDYQKANFETNKAKKEIQSPMSTTPAAKEKIQKFNFKRANAEGLQKLIDENPGGQFLHRKNIDGLARALITIGRADLEKSQSILLSLVRSNFYRDEDIEALIHLRDKISDNGMQELASFVSMLGFIYIRGSGGWHSLADSKYNYLALDALKLSKKTAEKTLSSEMSNMFFKDGYFTGPVRHFIEFFSPTSKTSLAKDIWQEAYEVIKFRLPTYPELDEVLVKETPSFKFNQRKPLLKAIKDLIDARLKITG